jgi:hypothetical protein
MRRGDVLRPCDAEWVKIRGVKSQPKVNSVGLFVRIEQATPEEGSAARLLFAGELVATKVACLTDFILRDAPKTGEHARISDYPRWAESGLALFLRLLKVSAPIPELSEDAVGRFTVELTDDPAGRVFVDHGGRVLSMKGCRESVEIEVQPEWLDCTLITPEALVADMRVIARSPVSVQNAICIALAEALGWKPLSWRHMVAVSDCRGTPPS